MSYQDDVEKWKNQVEAQYYEERAKNSKANFDAFQNLVNSNSQYEENLIRWQLDLKEDLDNIKHLLKGENLEINDNGELEWKKPVNEKFIPFNEFGVQLIMNVLSFYLNRNTLLSYYDEETIQKKVYDFGNEIVDLIHNRYEEMGMDTDEKRKMYPLIVRELVDTVHSAYLRALRGGERRSLRTARSVMQTESLNEMPEISKRKRFNLNPFARK